MSDNLNVRHVDFDVGEVRLHAAVGESEGRTPKATLLFLHGFPEFWYCWRHQIRHFSPDYRVVAPDLRGYNLSDKPEGIENYRMPHLVGDIVGLIDALGEERVVLVAHDWGGALAWAFAASHPERLHHLIILNAPHPSLFMRDMILEPTQQEASQYIHLLRDRKGEAELSANGFARLQEFIFGSMPSTSEVSQEELQRYLEAWSQPGALTGMLNYYRAMPLPPPKSGEIPTDATSRQRALERIPNVMISVPTLVVWGLLDHALRPSLLEGLEAFVPDLEIERIEEGSHWIPHQNPDQVNARVGDYLDRRLQPAGS